MSNHREDNAFTRNHYPSIKRALGEALLSEASVEDDILKATDMMPFLKFPANGVRIGIRIRRRQYFQRYGDEFTIRSKRPISGNKTELAKILEGFGDYIFYGFSADDGHQLYCWTVGCLDAFRRWHAGLNGSTCWQGQDNADGYSCFRAYKWADIPGIVVAGSGLLVAEPTLDCRKLS